jgi:predicted O-methyltransferase YrrM
VELGSGVSTLIGGYTLLKQGSGRIITVDQSAEFLDYVAQNLRQHRLEDIVQVLHASLTPVEINGQVWDWYDRTRLDEIEDIDFLVIDGPAQFNNPKAQVRYPALPLLYHKLTPGAYILLDDANREDEQQIVTRWLAEFDLKLIRDYSYETEKGAKLLQKGS